MAKRLLLILNPTSGKMAGKRHLADVVEAFVRAATGEIPFTHFSPVHLTTYEEEIALRKDVTLPIRD